MTFLHELEGTVLEFINGIVEDKTILRLDFLHPIPETRVSDALG